MFTIHSQTIVKRKIRIENNFYLVLKIFLNFGLNNCYLGNYNLIYKILKHKNHEKKQKRMP